MPSFSSSSSIRVASQDHVLCLKIRHNLFHGSPSDTVHSIKGRVPKELDVLWLSDISISLSGSLDGHQIPAHDIACSGLVHHLQSQLNANADQLGLNNVSRPFVDDVDGLSKLTLTPSRPLPDSSRPHANLVSLHIAYSWRTLAGCSDIPDSGRMVGEINPFSPALFLPAEALLNRATEQILANHLVSRYPLIFGPWCKRLDLEMQYFPSIGHSIVEIMSRSKNYKFLSKCERLLKMARKQHKFVLQTATTALSSCTNDANSETSEDEVDQFPAMPALTDEQVLCESLEQLFRMGVPQRRFKAAVRHMPQSVSLPEDDGESLLQNVPDNGIDDEDPWIELAEVAASPCALVADSPQTQAEDVDLFAQEDWPEGGTWRLHEANASLDERDHSNGDHVSLANITTRSTQAGPVADVSYCELNPDASGLGYKFAYLEDPGIPATFANPACPSSHELHDPCYSNNYERARLVGTCLVDSEGFETLDGWSDREEDAMLFEDVPDAVFEEPLV